MPALLSGVKGHTIHPVVKDAKELELWHQGVLRGECS